MRTTEQLPHAGSGRRSTPACVRPDGDDAIPDDLRDALFIALPRRDQHRNAMAYLRGLLGTPGRKTARNMAAALGGNGVQQSLHHFVSGSTWDWSLMRRALAHHVTRVTAPSAWVVRPMTIPKFGDRSAGVHRYYSSDHGRVLNAQLAIGIWAASARLSVPLNWRLHLPESQITDCVANACRELESDWELPSLPVVVNAPDLDTAGIVSRLHAEGMRCVGRIAEGVRLTVADPRLTGLHAGTATAGAIIRAAREWRRPVVRVDQERGRPHASCAVSSVSVGVPTDAALPGKELRLVGVWQDGQRDPAELWLTGPGPRHATAVPNLSRSARRVDHDLTKIAEPVGVRDYSGRSHDGWHRHVTLASAAHAAVVIPGAARRPIELAS
ncbi:IS701 family transposase [Kibdelosporangium aridum]|uniref:IS701 family transposase n=1 Tax=Kibdelosporangium aridum TaxID=2030 RepID=UPI00068F31B3